MRRTVEEVEAHLARRLATPLPGPDAQRRFAPLPLIDNWAPDQAPETARRAAVLVLVYAGPTGAALPLTVRPATLPTHAGQISLPGGALHAGESVEAAALREAAEEIGLEPATVQILGTLSTLWIPISNFVLTPVIGLARSRPTFRPHTPEVDALIELPLDRLLDRSSVRWSRRLRGDTRIDYPYFDIGGQAVWGATAMVLSEFVCLFEPAFAPEPRPDP